jgi:hypothetical protein
VVRQAAKATDSGARNRMNHPSLSLSWSDFSSRYFLKLSELDISEKMKFP